MRNYIAAFFIIFSCHASATSQAEERLIAALNSAKPGLSIQTVTEGTFGRNGEQYIAAISAVDPVEPENGTEKLVLFKMVAGTPKFVAQTEPFDNSSRFGVAPYFKNGILLLGGDASCGAVCHSATIYKFQVRDGEYRLIGVEDSYVRSVLHNKDGVVDEAFLVTTTKSINLLTNNVRYSGESCRSSDSNPWDCAAKSKGSEKILSFVCDHIWTLENFSPDLFSDFEGKTKNLHGVINHDLRYIENKP